MYQYYIDHEPGVLLQNPDLEQLPFIMFTRLKYNTIVWIETFSIGNPTFNGKSRDDISLWQASHMVSVCRAAPANTCARVADKNINGNGRDGSADVDGFGLSFAGILAVLSSLHM